ncbi:MAG: flagellar biosynthesis protein FlhA [Rhodocyclaceae bacterium]|jgi:flagellar biosynthesis protein FlhA|nr:flagellar biosynthesis protein FlhA [Rhodocyclaceae bacterium]MCA3074881.1 flagellar biosynthesis protein FlhA [Rhodocyclaceae bacterium]MCA3089732.1 flagellar biosynthesis protein FlhA [Rhodocyclaceae bacterium]MCA3094573.1 flagellar biosynthesis protein FlhA [Rhodocyclaceae bacterium]MCA3098221.1 flagellar biosynthesis protein FlhA [Rhodocyclaceae bacterium]
MSALPPGPGGALTLPGGQPASSQWTRAAAPMLIILVLAMMVLPLPTLLLDLLFTFNIALSVIVLLVALYTLKPLEFSVFPTILLVTTLLRLSLNVASTRVILLEGHTGPDAAGQVIEAFGHFLIGGNYAVGLIVFIILVVINFVVITKGAGRIAEVAARFTLDAMPGKQMAIDADLNAGLIREDEARARRQAIAAEADFYGSMDGASKFVRGDAIAGILIVVINIVGGLLIGMLQHGMGFGDATETYVLLTIGDGLVAQIPALVISTAAGIVVSRAGSEQDLSNQFIGQMFNRPQVMYITAGMIGLVGLIPGMPNLAFLAIAGGLGWIGWYTAQKQQQAAALPPPPPPPRAEPAEVGWNDVVPVDMLGLEVGYRLIPLVDRSQDGELLKRIRGIRKKVAQDLGFLVPAVHIRDNLELRPNAYRILLKGVDAGTGEVFPGMFLAINPGRVLGNLQGTATKDPAFGLPATWIDAGQRDQAQSLGYTVVDAGTVVATHLSNMIQSNAHELLGREETQALLDHIAKDSPKLVEDLVPRVLNLTVVQRVLQNLLSDGVHIRDMRTIIESLAEHGAKTQDAEELTSHVRIALGRAIMQSVFPGAGELPVIALDPTLEQMLTQMTQGRAGDKADRQADGAGLEPSLAENLLRQAAVLAQTQEQSGQPAVLLVAPALRALLMRFLKRAVPQLKVISHSEIPDSKTIRVVAVLGGRG